MKETAIGLLLSLKELLKLSIINLSLLVEVQLQDGKMIQENDPNRQFNGANLKKLANTSSNGTYESCKYTKSGNVITLTCSWR